MVLAADNSPHGTGADVLEFGRRQPAARTAYPALSATTGGGSRTRRPPGAAGANNRGDDAILRQDSRSKRPLENYSYKVLIRKIITNLTGPSMTTDLAVVRQLHNTLDLPERDRCAAEAVAAGLRDAKAENTRRAYSSAWQQFRWWAEAGGHPALPAAPQAVALYLGHLASTGRSIATVQQARSAISHFHAAAGMGKGDNPALHPVVSEAVKGWRNRAPAPRQADALTADALARVREVLRLPKRGRGGRMESADTARRRVALDLAIIGVLADGGLRRSEAAALTWGDVELWADGTGRLTIQKGKNQVEPATVAVTAATARALRDIRPDNVDPAAPVFGLTGETLANRVRAAARAAGLGDGFSGHSGRIGMARRMGAAGAPNAAVQRQGRWKHGDIVARYKRDEAAGEALKWLT